MSGSVSRLRWRDGWILSPRGDLAVFAGPVLVAGVLIVAFERFAGLDADVPPWAFVLLVVGCDVAHVYATAFRTYLDPDERRRRPVLYAGVPLACFAVGLALHLVSAALFWRSLAYLAAFHFVRQQYGWMAYSARKAGETSRFDRVFDQVAIYDVTVFPLLWWHAHLPRAFRWFVQGDFAPGVPPGVVDALMPLHFAILGAWLARQAWHAFAGRGLNRAKVLVLGTTWLAWYGGIVAFDSDLAFTATNVLAHGVPYLAVVHRFGAARWRTDPGSTPPQSTPPHSRGGGGTLAALFTREGFPLYFAMLAGAAFLEEWAWDRLVWHDHGTLFAGPDVALGSVALSAVVAVLAVPQATHYVLDAFLWRTGSRNPGLAERLGLSRPRAREAARAT